jgi:hypothetical protein
MVVVEVDDMSELIVQEVPFMAIALVRIKI